jgi:epoxide hydrolase-like predicted phosphatase
VAPEDGTRSTLLVDWGGVLTTDVFASFDAFCEAEGLEAGAVAGLLRDDHPARDLLVGFEEGRLDEPAFSAGIADALGLARGRADGIIGRLFGGSKLDPRMVAAVRAARAAGVRTGLVSNSGGAGRYPRRLLDDLFDGVVISGEVGMRKPAPEIYALGAERCGSAPEACVYVDDFAVNLPPAQDLGMAVVHHTKPEVTIAELERVLGVTLAA